MLVFLHHQRSAHQTFVAAEAGDTFCSTNDKRILAPAAVTQVAAV